MINNHQPCHKFEPLLSRLGLGAQSSGGILAVKHEKPGKRQALVNFRLNNLNMAYTLEVQGSPMVTWNSDSFTIFGM